MAQVIKAKYEAGLLKPYDYIKGYERMNRWMDSGRAAPQDRSRASSFTTPSKGDSTKVSANCTSWYLQSVEDDVNYVGNADCLCLVAPVPSIKSSISAESRRRILAALAGFRPKFRQIAKNLTDVDLVFIEEAMDRLMLEYDRTLAC